MVRASLLIAQWLERLTGDQKIVGSSPTWELFWNIWENSWEIFIWVKIARRTSSTTIHSIIYTVSSVVGGRRLDDWATKEPGTSPLYAPKPSPDQRGSNPPKKFVFSFLTHLNTDPLYFQFNLLFQTKINVSECYKMETLSLKRLFKHSFWKQ